MRDLTAIRADLAELELLGVTEAIARTYHVTVDELLGTMRCPPIPAARRSLWLELVHRGFSLARIGRIVGRDHSTILDGVRSLTGAIRLVGGCVRCQSQGTLPGSTEPCELCAGTGNDSASSPLSNPERRTA